VVFPPGGRPENVRMRSLTGSAQEPPRNADRTGSGRPVDGFTPSVGSRSGPLCGDEHGGREGTSRRERTPEGSAARARIVVAPEVVARLVARYAAGEGRAAIGSALHLTPREVGAVLRATGATS